jgi:bacillithiol biosynthesis cysteine-adding enzyme BshC
LGNKLLKRQLYNSFYHDYIADKSNAHDFINSPHHISWDQQIHSIDLNSSRYQKVKQILIDQNTDLTSEKANINLEYLTHPESVILITGQQLGLFASPLYTIYKIISTIKLAEYLNKQNNSFKYLPVFWLETEDHDFKEINHIGLLDKDFQPKRIIYEGKDRAKVSLRHYQIEPSISSFMSEIEENLLITEFSDDLFKKISENYTPNNNWMTAIRDFLKEIFHPYGLLFFQPGDEALKKISVDFFTQLLLKGKEIRDAFDNQSNKLMAMGYQNQVKNIPGQTFLHLELEDNQREHLYKEGESYFFKDSGKRFNQSEVISLITNNPIIVSSTVVSRPILQSWLLPVAAYIAGPGEIAYWAQLGEMFHGFELAMPVVYPRISATIVEPKIARYIGKYSLEIDDLPYKMNKFIETYFKNLGEKKGEDPLKDLHQLLDNETIKVESYLKTLDPTLVGIGKKSFERMLQTLDNLENRVIKVKEQKESQLTSHLKQIHASFFPKETPQERFQSPIYYLNKFGPDFIEHLFSELEIDKFNHQLLYL